MERSGLQRQKVIERNMMKFMTKSKSVVYVSREIYKRSEVKRRE